MKENIIEIDGSYGSGGGQVIRTALALSILTGKGFYIKNIRAKRKNPGLAPQHLTCVNTAAQICNAKVKGNLLGSKELFFLPKNIEFRNMEINIGTAGSISLLLQALMPSFVNIKRDIELHITGGTDVKMAPSIDYINNVLLKLLSKLGYKASLEIVKRGFYPRGGGKIIFKAEPMSLIKYEFTRRGMCKSVCGISIASKELKKRQVSERQAKKVKATLREKLREFEKIPIEIKLSYVESLNSGSSITLWCETDYSIIGADSIGERNKSSEEVAQEAALSLIKDIDKKAVVDVYASDQLLPYIALTYGCLKTSVISEHTRTNAFIIERFLPVKFKINDKEAIIKVTKK